MAKCLIEHIKVNQVESGSDCVIVQVLQAEYSIDQGWSKGSV
jgi:hypothetical protein